MAYAGYGQGQGWGQQQHPPPQPQQPPQQQFAYGGVGAQRQAVPASDQYGSYGQTFHQNVFQTQAWQAMGFGSGDELQALFEAKKSQRFNAIQAQELVSILNESPRIRNYYKINWSLELCKIMISMLDRSHDGMMQYPEFQELLQCLNYWFKCFNDYDTDRSGFIESHELGRVIGEKYGYRLTQTAITTLLKRYSRALDDGRVLIAFDDFVSMSVRLRAYTEAFRARDRQQHNGHDTGNTQFNYDDFLQCVMCL